MSKAGDVYENPVTGERVVTRVGGEESDGELVIADLYVRPDGAVAGEHVHPGIEEVFTVVAGSVGFRLDGREDVAGPGRQDGREGPPEYIAGRAPSPGVRGRLVLHQSPARGAEGHVRGTGAHREAPRLPGRLPRIRGLWFRRGGALARICLAGSFHTVDAGRDIGSRSSYRKESDKP